MPRILLLIILIFVIYWLIKRICADFLLKNKSENNTDKNTEKTAEKKMVQCAKCGTHVPESESIVSNNKVICNNPDCNTKNSKHD